MLSKAEIKHIKSLRLKKYRQKYKHFVAEGNKTVIELLHTQLPIVKLYAQKEWLDQNYNLLSERNIIIISQEELKLISTQETPNQVLAIIEIKDKTIDSVQTDNRLTLALDNIQDPGNMGAIIRIADWFKIENILCSEDCVDMYNTKVVNASMGTIGRVNIIYTDLVKYLKQINNVNIYGAVLNGENVYRAKISEDGIIVIGNEAHGISPEVRKLLTKAITIPANNQTADSLNAAVATGIFCAFFRSSSVRLK